MSRSSSNPGGPREFTAKMLVEVLTGYRQVLEIHRDAINRINVFPVADQDTGSNVYHTMVTVTRSLDPEAGLRAVAGEVADSALLAGRGASGLILSQALVGMARHLQNSDTAGAREIAAALQAASHAANGAVADPVEGTMITIARRAAEAAAWAADHGADLAGVTLAARSEAWKAVAETPSMLAALAEAGVVDSGAVSYALLLDVLQGTVHGTEIAVATIDTDADISSVLPDDRYELIVNLTQVGDPAELTAAWSSTGSSVAVATQYEDLRAHIHTSNVLSAYRAAAGLGKVTKVEMTDLHAYVASDTRQLTVLVASRVEEAEALLTLKPGRLLVPSDVASLVHIVETSGGHDLRFVVVGNDGDHVEEARALTGSDFPIHAVVETSEASALMHSQTAS